MHLSCAHSVLVTGVVGKQVELLLVFSGMTNVTGSTKTGVGQKRKSVFEITTDKKKKRLDAVRRKTKVNVDVASPQWQQGPKSDGIMASPFTFSHFTVMVV